MLIFRRIFNFGKSTVEQLEKRLNLRFVPGRGFPLQATLRHAGRDLSTKILDVSSKGVGVLISRDHALLVGHHLRVDLTLGPHRLEIEARIAHVHPQADGIYVGLGLVFGEFVLQKAYLQLLQPIVLGQSLQPMPAGQVVQDDPRFNKQVYVGESETMLTVRHDNIPGQPPHSFELLLPDSFCRGRMEHGTNTPYAFESREADGHKLAKPVFETSGGLHEEIRQLYRWILPNLSPAIPDEVRAFLQRFAG